jgi:hypothetical protein
MKSVEQLDLHTLVLGGKASEAKPTVFLGAADVVPGNKAVCPRGPPIKVLEKGTPKGVDRTQESRGQLQGAHCIRRQSIQDGVQKHDPPASRQPDRYLSTLAIRGWK